MLKILEEIKTSPGVMGACVYSSERGVLASNLPTVFNPDTQKRVSNTLHSIFKLNETVKLGINSYDVQYDEAMILVKRLCKLSSLVVICDPDTNIHLVNMAIGVLAADLSSQIEECERMGQEQPMVDLIPEPPPGPESDPVDAKTVLNELMVEEMTLIKKALAKKIGPIASMVLNDAVKEWLKKGPAHQERLTELAEDLLTEIDDEASRQEFMTELKAVL